MSVEVWNAQALKPQYVGRSPSGDIIGTRRLGLQGHFIGPLVTLGMFRYASRRDWQNTAVARSVVLLKAVRAVRLQRSRT